jgi:hypothetical protein
LEKVTWASSCEPGSVARSIVWSRPDASGTSCQVPVSVAGKSPIDRSSISSPNSLLFSRWARLNSFWHQSDASHARDTRNNTASHRNAAWLSDRSQRSPAAMPRSGSVSRKTSSQPCASSQSRSATALSLFLLEWLKNIRDITTFWRSSFGLTTGRYTASAAFAGAYRRACRRSAALRLP